MSASAVFSTWNRPKNENCSIAVLGAAAGLGDGFNRRVATPWLVVLGVKDQARVVVAVRPTAAAASFSTARTSGAVSVHRETA